MNELTLESLARRVEVLERALLMYLDRPKDWRRAIGMFSGNEFTRQVDAEGQAIRKAEREEALRAGDSDEPHLASTELSGNDQPGA